MEQNEKNSSRKKFLLWGAAIISSVTILKFIPGNKPVGKEKKAATVKMLGQDGKLVEVDAEKLFFSKGNKINDEQLKNWVSKRK